MEQVTFSASIDVATPPNTLRMVLGGALFVLSVLGIVWGLYARRPLTFGLIVLLVYALSLIMGARGARAVVPTQASLRIQNMRLELHLPGTKLHGKRYVNQIYLSSLDDMDGVGFLNGRMMLRSHLFESVGMDGTQVVSNRRLEMCEVTVGVDNAYWSELQGLLTAHGVRVFS